jgi:PIN domain nuclease of toxin-antitoxin system
MSSYVLDTSALLAYIEDEDGADKVEVLLLNAL